MQKAQLPVMSLLLNALALLCCWSLPDLPGGHGKSSRVLVNLLVLGGGGGGGSAPHSSLYKRMQKHFTNMDPVPSIWYQYFDKD